MENTKRQIIYYTATFTVAFFLGVLFNHYVFCQSVECVQETQSKEQETRDNGLEIVIQKEEQQDKEDVKGQVVEHKSVTQQQGCTMYIDVSGALKNPGVYCLDNDALIIDAVNKAGGFTKDAAIKFIYRRINLAQPLVNNQKLYFPFENELVCQLEPVLEQGKKVEVMYEEPVIYLPTTEPYIDQDPTTTSSPDSTTSTNNDDVQCVNINTATKEELITLSGVGESTAEKIIQGRPYLQVEDLLDVSGIGEATLENVRDMVCI